MNRVGLIRGERGGKESVVVSRVKCVLVKAEKRNSQLKVAKKVTDLQLQDFKTQPR